MINQNSNNFQWNSFQRHPRAAEIAEGLGQIPLHWALTPVIEKRPYRQGWQTETPVARHSIIEGILSGVNRISKTGKSYRSYNSGFGLRLGDISGGLLAIDIDGPSALPILETLSSGNLPETISWTSGKIGRKQLLFQIPDSARAVLASFTRKTLMSVGEIQTDSGELLEFRYNYSQSVLPPSYHPDTGAYQWLHSPSEMEVAIAPDWLIELLLKYSQEEANQQQEAQKKALAYAERKRNRNSGGWIGSDSIEEALEGAISRLSFEDIFYWSGHQFKQRGSKLVGCCPQHQSQSGTAFQVDPQSGAWFCHACEAGGYPVQYRYFLNGGTGTPTGKEFIDIAKTLCQEAGVSFPEKKQSGLAELIEEHNRREQEILAQYGKVLPLLEGQRRSLQGCFQEYWNQVKQTAHRFLAQEQLNTVEPKVLVPVAEPTALTPNYQPGALPAHVDQRVIYQSGQRLQLWSEAKARGYKVILDRSGTGQGKTTDAVNAKPHLFDFGIEVDDEGNEQPKNGQLVFFLPEPKSPAVDLLDCGWTRLPVLEDDNCHKKSQRRALAGKGLPQSQGQGGSDINPFCRTCIFLQSSDGSPAPCRSNADGHGYGFKFLMTEALQSPKVFGHPNGFPRANNSGAIAFFDEFESLIPPARTLEVQLKQLTRTFLRFQEYQWLTEAEGNHDYDLYDHLAFIKEYFEPYLCGQKTPPRFGFGFSDLKSLMPDWDEALTEWILQEVYRLEQEWADMDQRSLNAESTCEDVDQVVDEPWLAEFLSILLGEHNGALRLLGSSLQLTLPNTRMINLVKSFDCSILLDATSSCTDIALILGIEESEILETQQAAIATPNFEVVQLLGAGLNTSQRSQAGQSRKEQIKNVLDQTHDSFGTIDYKAWSGSGELNHFRSGDNGARGSNQFGEMEAVVGFGTPFLAVNAKLDEYQALTGELVDPTDLGFKQYYQRGCQKELIQELGRLRANLRPQQVLRYYIVSDFDCSFIPSELNLKLTRMPIWEFPGLLLLKPKRLLFLEQLAEFLAQVLSQGQDLLNLSQKATAAALNSFSSHLSRVVKPMGWKNLLRKINRLFYSLKEPVKTVSQVANFIEQQLLKLLGEDFPTQIETLAATVAEVGWETFSSILSQLPLSYAARVFALLAHILGNDQALLVDMEAFLVTDLGYYSEQLLRLTIPPL